jgi:hypothetical protein
MSSKINSKDHKFLTLEQTNFTHGENIYTAQATPVCISAEIYCLMANSHRVHLPRGTRYKLHHNSVAKNPTKIVNCSG